jgi:hypothetical protein
MLVKLARDGMEVVGTRLGSLVETVGTYEGFALGSSVLGGRVGACEGSPELGAALAGMLVGGTVSDGATEGTQVEQTPQALGQLLTM